MKYTGIFIIFSLIIIVLCGTGVFFIVSQHNPERYYLKGKHSFESGNYEAAIEALNEYLSFGKEGDKAEKARYFLASAIDSRRNEKLGLNSETDYSSKKQAETLAKKRYLDVIHGNSTQNYQVEAILGYAEIARKNEESEPFIINKLESVLGAKPGSEVEDRTYMLLGYQYYFNEEYNKAMRAFLNSANELSRIGQALTHLKTGKKENAFELMEDFFTYFHSSPNYPKVKKTYFNAVNNYANELQGKAEYRESTRQFQRLLKTFPQDEYSEIVRVEIGDNHYASKEYRLAEQFFTEAYMDRFHKKDDEALFKQGLSQYQQNEIQESYRSFNELVNLFPQSVYNTQARQWVSVLKKDLEYFN